jgi:hypothetical protein
MNEDIELDGGLATIAGVIEARGWNCADAGRMP